jgi:structure-specific recognition protein 1
MLCAGALQVMYDRVIEHTDAGVTVGDAVVTFDGLAVLFPRGRFEVELYLGFMKFLGQVSYAASSGSHNISDNA